MRQVALFVPKAKFGSGNGVELDAAPTRVWTAIPTDVKPPLPKKMRHHDNGFLEDRIHDWNWSNGKLRFYSRVTDGDCWLVLEYEDEGKDGRA